MTNRSPLWPQGEPTSLPLPPGTIVDALQRVAAARPDHVAMVYYGAELSYGVFAGLVERLAGHLRERCGVRPGDVVCVAMQNAPQYVIAYHAILRADAVVAPCNPMYRARELEHILTDSGARAALIGDELVDVFAPLVGDRLDHVVVARYADMAPDDPPFALPEVMTRPAAPLPEGGAWSAWRDACGHASTLPAATMGRDDLCMLGYTSGTTGAPKACAHRHHALLFTAVAQARWYGLGGADVLTGFMPLFHVAGMQGSMNAAIAAGATLVLMTRWDRDLASRLLQRYAVTFWNAAPTMISDVLSSEDFPDASIETVRVVTGGGAAMPEAVARRLRERYGLVFVEGYGMTETMSPTHINPMGAPKARCLGVPIHDTAALVVDADTLAELPDGEVGEIVVSGPQVCLGYLNRPDADAESFFERDGKRFLRTGDLGRRDAEGRFYAVDRLKRMINVSGFKVWPAELEAAFHEHPVISECCIVSMPDPYRGESVKAIVTLRPGADPETAVADIMAWARREMAAFKAPKVVEVVAALPRSATNKIDWRQLQDAEWAGR